MRALNEMRHKYGPTAFTRDHINYRMVGYERGDKTRSAIGDTWQEAITKLAEKKR